MICLPAGHDSCLNFGQMGFMFLPLFIRTCKKKGHYDKLFGRSDNNNNNGNNNNNKNNKNDDHHRHIIKIIIIRTVIMIIVYCQFCEIYKSYRNRNLGQ